MINDKKNLKEILRDTHIAAEDLRCALNDQPDFISQADKVLMLVHVASHYTHSKTCFKIPRVLPAPSAITGNSNPDVCEVLILIPNRKTGLTLKIYNL